MADYIDRNSAIENIEYEVIRIAKMLPDSENTRNLIKGAKDCVDTLRNMPSADVVEVVRCKDCKHCDKAWGWCNRISEIEDGTGTLLLVEPTDYCRWGEKE